MVCSPLSRSPDEPMTVKCITPGEWSSAFLGAMIVY
jgi:hypothetical protein